MKQSSSSGRREVNKALQARIHHAAGRHWDAVNCAIESLSVIWFQPNLHYLLGLSLRCLGEEREAQQALDVAAAQMFARANMPDECFAARPENALGGEDLVEIARGSITPPGGHAATQSAHAATPLSAFEPQDFGPPEDRKQVVTVVTGLPRSGTSMMMQMLVAAGFDPYTDGRRVADEDNPRGYFEHQNATRLHEDASWVAEARGKAVKVRLKPNDRQ